MIVIAILFHILILYKLPTNDHVLNMDSMRQPVKISLNQKQIDSLNFDTQQKTETPENAKFYANEDHRANRDQKADLQSQMKLKKTENNAASATREKTLKNQENSSTLTEKKQNLHRDQMDETYKRFLPSQEQSITQVAQGFQDYLDEAMVLGDTNNVNTREHPLMGFFSQIRRSVEMAFYDPEEIEIARYQNRTGIDVLRGSTVALIDIDRTGRIIDLKVLKTSGHDIMDEHWLKILRASGPFQPIPKFWPKDHLKFSYTLNYRYTSL